MEQQGPHTDEQAAHMRRMVSAGKTAAQPQARQAARPAAQPQPRTKTRRLRVKWLDRKSGPMQPPESKRARIAAGRAKLIKKAERSALRSAADKARNAVDAG